MSANMALEALETARVCVQALQAENAALREALNAAQDETSRLQSLTLTQHQANKKLHDEVLELYRDLRATDLTTLILRVALSLTEAEQGLFVEPDGDGTLAAIGLEELPEAIQNALYEFSRKAAREGEPLVCNDSKALPDGANLVNLAAMPVALKNEARGVILVANKRGGPFTDEDTEILLAIGRHAGLALENNRLHSELGEAYAGTVAVLADAIEAKDAYTRGHCQSVSDVAVEVAERLGFSQSAKDEIRYAALLHDIGKIGVPDRILLKPGRLAPEEFFIIQKHAQIGRDLVARVPALLSISDLILHHHEKWDGSGYPDGLAGEGIPIGARIIGAVDALDAMTTPRPYRNPVGMEEAIAEMQRCSGTQFDPQIVDLVADIIGKREN